MRSRREVREHTYTHPSSEGITQHHTAYLSFTLDTTRITFHVRTICCMPYYVRCMYVVRARTTFIPSSHPPPSSTSLNTAKDALHKPPNVNLKHEKKGRIICSLLYIIRIFSWDLAMLPSACPPATYVRLPPPPLCDYRYMYSTL